MDPNVTLREFVEAVDAGDRYTANEKYSALRAWLDRGGYEPEWAEHVGQDGLSRREFFAYDVRTGKIGVVS